MDDVSTHLQSRPYYDPDTFNAGYTAVFKPEQGVVDNHGFTIASKLNISPNSKSKFANKLRDGGMLSQLTTGLKKQVQEAENSAEEAKKSLGDMEWADLLNMKSWKTVGTQLLEQFLRRYVKHLIQQPFETARLLLQVGNFQFKPVTDKSKITLQIEDDEDGDDEEIDFFPETSAPVENQDSSTHHRNSHSVPTFTKKIQPESLHTMDILNAVMDEEGTKGLWRANNTTFIYNFLSITLDAWFTGMLSPFLQIPDPYFIDIIHSPDAQKSILLTAAASVFTGLVLLPIDLIRTRLTVTSVKVGERSLRNLLKKWSWTQHMLGLPLEMVSLCIGYSLTSTMFRKLTAVVLYHQFNVDKYSRALWYNTFEFMSRIVELFIKLPLENLLRRSQVSYLLRARPHDPLTIHEEDMIIEPRQYKGIWTTLKQKGRVHELWRGWRLGLMSVVCGYGLKLMDRDALEEEKF